MIVEVKQRPIEKIESGLTVEILTLLAIKKRGEATELLVEKIMKENYIYTTRDDLKSEMWIYNKGIYIPEGKSYIKEYCRRILGQAFNNYITNEVVTKIEADTYIDSDVFFQTNYIYEIPVMNGILNIISLKLESFNPKKIFFNKIPIKYDPEKDCPNILKHFETVLKDKSDVPVLLELFGYLLLKEYRIEKAFMFVGKGRNGKSKTLELMKRFLGSNNCSALPLSCMKAESFSLSELFGKMANLAGDLSSTDLKETGTIKNLVGRDTIQAKRKFLRDLSFINYAKVVFAANELPKVYDTNDGFWTKWILLEFPYQFMTQQEIDKLPEEERKDKRLINTNILDQICSEDEMSGLLNLSLKHLKNLLSNKEFSYSKGTKDVKDLWIRKSDSFTSFCIDCLEEDYNNFITKKDLRKNYSIYCKFHKIKGTSDKGIKATLQNMYGVDESRKYLDIGSQFLYVWEGIKFNNNISSYSKQ